MHFLWDSISFSWSYYSCKFVRDLRICALMKISITHQECWYNFTNNMDQIYSKYYIWFLIACINPLLIIEVSKSDFVDRKERNKSINMLVQLYRHIILSRYKFDCIHGISVNGGHLDVNSVFDFLDLVWRYNVLAVFHVFIWLYWQRLCMLFI